MLKCIEHLTAVVEPRVVLKKASSIRAKCVLIVARKVGPTPPVTAFYNDLELVS